MGTDPDAVDIVMQDFHHLKTIIFDRVADIPYP